MDNLIYIWIINRLLEFCQSIMLICVGITTLLGFLLTFFTLESDTAAKKEEFKPRRKSLKRWVIAFLTLSFFFGLAGKFSLDKTEFKAVVAYLVGKEVVQSERAEKIITIIDTKLDDWLKKIEKH